MKENIPAPANPFIAAPFTVVRKEYITPHYLRIFLTGERVAEIAETTVGINNKIIIPPAGTENFTMPKMNLETKSWEYPGTDSKPIIRTYTHRGIDLDKKEIWIDFVVHGDEGPASAWAINSNPGDALGVMMKRGKKELYSSAEHYVLVGDATAIPVIGAILEDLPESARGVAILEVYGENEEQFLDTKADIEIIWTHNFHPQKGSNLASILKQRELPIASRFAYVAAEFSTVKEIRNYLRKEQGWEREELYAYSYWKSGVAEDRSVTDRRTEMVKDDG